MLYCTISLGQWTPPYSPEAEGLSAPVQTSMNEGESGNVLLPFILLSSWLAVLWPGEGGFVESDRGERKRGCCCTIARDGFAAAAAGKALLFSFLRGI